MKYHEDISCKKDAPWWHYQWNITMKNIAINLTLTITFIIKLAESNFNLDNSLHKMKKNPFKNNHWVISKRNVQRSTWLFDYMRVTELCTGEHLLIIPSNTKKKMHLRLWPLTNNMINLQIIGKQNRMECENKIISEIYI